MLTPVLKALKSQIDLNGGTLTLHDYLVFCLQHPQFGYYRHKPAIGKDADFITAPQISQIFGELIGLYLIQNYKNNQNTARKKAEKIHVLELGPGQGLLLKDLMRTFKKVCPALLDSIHWHSLEINGVLDEIRAHNMPLECVVSRHVTIDDALQAMQGGPTYIVANEFFDALPIRQYIFQKGSWHEIHVCMDEGSIHETVGPVVKDLPLEGYPVPKNGDRLEVSPATEQIFKKIVTHLDAHQGVGLFIDYGYGAPAYGDSLQALSHHQMVNPFENPGSYDLTTHVNFWRLEHLVSQTKNLRSDLGTQAHFLKSLGIELRTSLLMRNQTPEVSQALYEATQRLIDPNQMGHLFKVLQVWSPA